MIDQPAAWPAFQTNAVSLCSVQPAAASTMLGLPIRQVPTNLTAAGEARCWCLQGWPCCTAVAASKSDDLASTRCFAVLPPPTIACRLAGIDELALASTGSSVNTAAVAQATKASMPSSNRLLPSMSSWHVLLQQGANVWRHRPRAHAGPHPWLHGCCLSLPRHLQHWRILFQ